MTARPRVEIGGVPLDTTWTVQPSGWTPGEHIDDSDICEDCGERHVGSCDKSIIAELRYEAGRLRQGLWDTWVALGHDTDGDTNPGALIAGMGVDGFIRMVIDDAARYRRESEEDYAADTDRLRARAEKAERALTAPLRREDLEEAVSALGYVHSDYCISTRPCRCSAIADRLEAAIKSVAD